MINARIKLVGDKALRRQLMRLDEKAARKIMRSAISAALTPILQQAKANVPVRTGILRAALRKKLVKEGRAEAVGKVYVDPEVNMEFEGRPYRPSKYAHLVEFGAKNMPARPFLRPAMAAGRPAAMGIIQEKVRSWLAKGGFR